MSNMVQWEGIIQRYAVEIDVDENRVSFLSSSRIKLEYLDILATNWKNSLFGIQIKCNFLSRELDKSHDQWMVVCQQWTPKYQLLSSFYIWITSRLWQVVSLESNSSPFSICQILRRSESNFGPELIHLLSSFNFHSFFHFDSPQVFTSFNYLSPGNLSHLLRSYSVMYSSPSNHDQQTIQTLIVRDISC